MALPTPKTRPTGATATLGRTGFPHVTSATDGSIDIVTGATQAGFNPIDMLYGSLAACLAMSARIASSRYGVLDRLTGVTVSVKGEKASDEPSRITRFDIHIDIQGDIDAITRHAIAHDAESEICTVSNTIRGNPEFVTVVSE